MFANLHTIDLSKIYGSEWEGCEFRFTPMPYRDVVALQEKTESEQASFLIDMLSKNFVSGTALTSEKEKKEITHEEFTEYFLEIRFVNKALQMIMNAYSEDSGLSQE